MYSDLKECCVSIHKTLFDAIRIIDQAGAGIALVIDDQERLVGTLTDGDIRRAILQKNRLDSPLLPYIKKEYFSVSENEGRANVLDLMQAHLIEQIPVIDQEKKLIGLHLIHSILGTQDRPNWAVIMAGGKGTRLYPLTKNIPKPMVNVAGRPILERLVLHLVSHGIHHIFLSVNYLSDIIKDHFGNGERFGCQIEYLNEDEPLGTAGSLSLLPQPPTHPILVMNGDLVMNADLGAMLDYHEQCNYHATIGVKTYSHQVPYGCVTLQNDCIVKIDEKPDLVQQVNAGIYVLSPKAVQTIPKQFYPITDLFSSALEKNHRLGAFNLDCDWVDIGQHDQLKQARGEV